MGQYRRRTLIGAGAALMLARPALAKWDDVRTLSFNNLHTGERLSLDYWTGGAYIPDSLAAINHVLRDFRTGEVHAIEPRLLDLLAMLRAKLETDAPVEVISGYRSPKTNATLRGEGGHSGVAAHSLHMQGMAIDIRIADRGLDVLHRTALAMKVGGVGYYPQSDFVHVDVGRVRSW